MNKFIAIFLGLSLLIITGCVSPTVEFAPPQGALFTSYKAPLLIKYNETPVGTQKGSASASYFREPIFTGLDFSWDDASLRQASQDGQIKKVGIADYEFFRVLGIYAKTTVHVYNDPSE